jgi:hypothetical protein
VVRFQTNSAVGDSQNYVLALWIGCGRKGKN